MKKRFFAIFLIALTLCLTLSGCVINDKPVNTEEASDTDETSIARDDDNSHTEKTFTPKGRILGELYEYLDWQNMCFGPPEPGIERKIDYMISGHVPVLVDYEPDDFYFVCAYYICTHEMETEEYCCKEKYSWIGFYSEEYIPETYLGKPLIAAFQINKAGRGESIIDDLEVPYFESIRMYQPIFENGKNVADSVKCDSQYLYICANYELDYETIYVFSGYLTFFEVISYMELEGKTYFDFYIDWVENVDEDRIEEVLREEFGRYYDSLRPITITDKYTEVNHWGRTEQYALIDLDDFMAFIKDTREEIVAARK